MDITCRNTYTSSQWKMHLIVFEKKWFKFLLWITCGFFFNLKYLNENGSIRINHTWGKHQVNNHYKKYNLLE
jgi:hypothetical protein